MIDSIHTTYDENIQFDWCLTIPNAMIVAACFLWKDNYADAVEAAILSGFDTDCNGATIGSVFGLLYGADGIPEHLRKVFPETVNTSVHGYNRMTISDLVKKTISNIK